MQGSPHVNLKGLCTLYLVAAEDSRV